MKINFEINIVNIILVLIILLLGFGMYKMHVSQKQTEQLIKQNGLALRDSIKTFQNKFEEFRSEKSSYITTSDLESLKEWNKDLYKDVKNEIGEVKSLTNTKVVINRIDTVYKNKIEKVTDSTYKLNYINTFTDSGYTQLLELQSLLKSDSTGLEILESKLIENMISLDLKIVHKIKDDTVVVSASSLSPYVKFNELEGYTKIDISNYKKQPKFIFGPQIGVYPNLNSPVYVSPYIGLGITYNVNRHFDGMKIPFIK